MNDADLDLMWALRFRIGYTVRYHRDREQLLDFCDKLAKAVAVIAGSATIATVVRANDRINLAVAALITISSIITLVFGISERAREHRDLARRYLELEGKIAGAVDPSPQQIAEFEAALFAIERDGRGTFPLLVQDCQNREAVARGCFDAVHPIPWWKRRLMRYVNLPAEATPPPPPRPE